MKQLLLIFSLILIAKISYSQLSYNAANAVNTTGTYTDLGTDGRVIATPGFDDDNSGAQNIGFSFSFNGTTFTQFVLNTNGVIKLGATAPADAALYDALGAPETNLIYPLNLDLEGGTDPEYRVFTSGVAPDRICTIQFKNVSDYWQEPDTAPQFSDMDFQIKLYETSNNIGFVYGTFVAGGAPSAAIFAEVGIKGNDAATSVNATKASASAWASSTFINGDYDYASSILHNIRNTILPVPGTTYGFVYAPLPDNDAQVSNVYTLGGIPVGYGSPHIVKAIVKNVGAATITNLAVTLNVTGANTFTDPQTVATLAAGASATVNFAGFSPTNIGTNTVTVSVAPDDNNMNNSVAVTQAVSAGTFSYADNSASTNAIGYNFGAGLLLTKYTLTGTAFITSVNISISNDSANTGNTIYAVVLDAAGTIIGQSANYVILEGDLGNYKNLPILTAPAITSADFFVGLAQTANATAGYFPVGTQTESPGRASAYYVAPLPGGAVPTENATLGRFMIQAVVAAAPVPVKLLSFSGRIQNNNAFLNWQTSNEEGNDRFEVERSATGSGTWLKIGTVIAVGNSATTNKYQFADPGLINGQWMYRLKIFDLDGKFNYSPVVILRLTGKSFFVLEQNYPNPVRDITMIRYELGNDALVTFELISMDGKKIMVQQKGKQTKGSYNFPVDVTSLALSNGKYVYSMVVQNVATGEISTIKKEMIVLR